MSTLVKSWVLGLGARGSTSRPSTGSPPAHGVRAQVRPHRQADGRDKEWLVHAKAPFGGPRALFKYLGLYTHRVAISNHRLLEVSDGEIVFRTRGDKVCRLEPVEFIRRFLQHVLPRGFVKIRQFGLYAAGNVRSRLVAARAALEARRPHTGEREERGESEVAVLDWRDLLCRLTGIDLHLCPECGAASLHWEPLPQPAVGARAPPESS
jgi:hypothetical protein